MGSHTRVAPWGKTISTRVVTSKPRHFSAWRGLKGSCCASASFGNAAAAGNIAPPVFRNARLSMSVLRSIEALSHNADPGVPTRARAEYPVSVAAKGAEAGERKLQESGGRARKQGRRSPISPSERQVPREPAGCAKPIITASERELREVRRCWMIIGRRCGGYGRVPRRTIYSESVPDHKSLGLLRRVLQPGGRSFLIVSSTD